MAIWDSFLTENDKKALSMNDGAPTLAAAKPRAKAGFGEQAALLVIDMQNVSCGEDRPIHEQIDKYPSACGTYAWAAMRHMQRLIPAARAAGIPVIYTKQLFRPHTGMPQAQASSAYSSLNPLSEIAKEIAMQEGDLLIEADAERFFWHRPRIHAAQSQGRYLARRGQQHQRLRSGHSHRRQARLSIQGVGNRGVRVRPDRIFACGISVRPAVQILRCDQPG